jgi:DNA-directed RNA polymerase specialized sigma24 family protein
MTQLAKDVASSVREETDFELLTTIGCADIDQGQAERAFETLYDRYVGLLKGMALNAGWDRYGVDSDMLIQETFLKAWAKAGNFDPRKRYKDTPEESAVKLWLLAIFRNAFLDELRKLGRRQDNKLVEPKALDAESDDVFGDEDDASTAVSSGDDVETAEMSDQHDEVDSGPAVEIENPKVKLARKWLGMQTQGDRELLLASVEYIDFRTGKCVIPTDHLKGLAAMLGVIPETIKVKRGRLLARLKAFVIENS